MKSCFTLLVVEGYLDGVASRVLLNSLGVNTQDVALVDKGGGSIFWKDVQKYNFAAQQGLVWALTDLEKFPCASGLIQKHLKNRKHQNFILRIAKPMLESWLLADRQSFASFLGVPLAKISHAPENEPNPKQRIVRLAQRSSRREIREDLVPTPGSAGIVGPGYTSRMEEFISRHWKPERAAELSQSLRRAIAAVHEACAV
jgi:hypothetical protein